MTKRRLSQERGMGLALETQCNSSYKQIKKKRHTLFMTVAEKAFDRNQ